MTKNHNIQYQVRQVVWAKVGGYPWWPALINTIDYSDHNPKYMVNFFGDTTYSFLDRTKICKFQENYKLHKLAGYKNKNLKISIDIAEDYLTEKGKPIKHTSLFIKQQPIDKKTKPNFNCEDKQTNPTQNSASNINSTTIQNLNNPNKPIQIDRKQFSSKQNRIQTLSQNPYKHESQAEKQVTIQQKQQISKTTMDNRQLVQISKNLLNHQKHQEKTKCIEDSSKFIYLDANQQSQKRDIQVCYQARNDSLQECQSEAIVFHQQQKIMGIVNLIKKLDVPQKQAILYLQSVSVPQNMIEEVIKQKYRIESDQILKSNTKQKKVKKFNENMIIQRPIGVVQTAQKNKDNKVKVDPLTISIFKQLLRDKSYNLRLEQITNSAVRLQRIICDIEPERGEKYDESIEVCIFLLSQNRYSFDQVKRMMKRYVKKGLEHSEKSQIK